MIKNTCAVMTAVALMSGAAFAQEAPAATPQTPAATAPATTTEQAAPAPQDPAAATAPQAPVPAPAAQPAPAATDAVATIGSPAQGKGQIVFYRASKFVGAAVSFKVREGETELGKLSNGAYFAIDVTPGQHEYVVHSEVKDTLPIEVDEGEVYYVEGSLSMGVMVGRPNLSPSDKTKFDAAGKMKLSKLKS